MSRLTIRCVSDIVGCIMAGNRLTDSQLQEVIDAYNKIGSKVEAAKHLGMSYTKFRDRFRVAKERIEYGVPDGQMLSGLSTLRGADGEVKLQWVKTKAEHLAFQDGITDMLEEAKSDLPRAARTKKLKPDSFYENIASVIPIGDAHIGMFAWKEECGADWDLEIALREMCAAFKYLIAKAPPSQRCIILNVGDYFHYSKMEATTERSGHVLEAAGRPQNMFDCGLKIMRYVIDASLKKHNIVEVVNASGNHDGLLAFVLSSCLANIYENEPRVVIHTQPTMRHYIRYGTNLIGVVHGDKTKDKDLPLIMATEMADDWGDTKHRTWFRGHHHHDSKIEYMGVYVEQVRTFAPKDAYAAGGGYLSGRDIKQIYFHKKFGRQGQDTCTPEMIQEMLVKHKK